MKSSVIVCFVSETEIVGYADICLWMVCLLDISGSDLLCSEDNALDTAVACERTETSSLGR